MNITYIKDRSIVLVTSEFRVLSATKDTCNWPKVIAAVEAEDEQALIRAMSMKAVIEDFGNTGLVEVRGSDVFYRGKRLYGEDVSRIFDYVAAGFPSHSMVKFLDAKFKNVVPSAVSGLYNFLTNKEMPITDNGTILGFKGVRADLFSVHSGQEPLISGRRDTGGSIYNGIGETVWMERRHVLADNEQGCGPGLHIGSRQYATGWGPRVMVVEFSPEHAVSVPNGDKFEVLRVNKYKVVGELNQGDYLGETFNGDYARPDDEPVVEIEVPKNMYNISDWSRGQSIGFKDGTAHAKRKFYEVDKGITTANKEYVDGYLRGYKDGR